ncbi:hypothetical protein J3459_013563 [Metarhizium acridum]|nr:hypothetical protein J3459_013563 [Metarhizium acridum]
MSWFYSAPETRFLQTALKPAHLILELRSGTVSLGRLKVHHDHVIPIPHKKVMLINVNKFNAELMQPA